MQTNINNYNKSNNQKTKDLNRNKSEQVICGVSNLNKTESSSGDTFSETKYSLETNKLYEES